MYDRLEDEFGDVVSKSRRGQELTLGQLAERCDLGEAQISQIESYEWTPEDEVIVRLAAALGLSAQRLSASARSTFFPAQPAGAEHGDLTVDMLVLGTSFLMNGYVVGCPVTGIGAVVDPGFQATRIMEIVERRGWKVESVFLTHGHDDHISALDEICEETGAAALISDGDASMLGGRRRWIRGPLVPGQAVEVGSQQLQVRSTSGHTSGGVSLLHAELAFVGDALFAGSLGGTRNVGAFEEQRFAVAEHLLKLPASTTLYPGHGPATTAGEEAANNPFFNN
ncbi:MAG: MBL fold metallo-hydrolase [Candidatus Latescibacterota bacterium]|nr:MBL fold metallo-hydrolase [Candidatus Latescibacterota bacterium]